MRILLVEDNQKLASYIKKALQQVSYAVDCAGDGESGEQLALSGDYDVIILDIMLPKKDGIALCKELRSQKINTPIIMLTAKSQLEDLIEGLDSGADDYLAKPFALQELLARVRALLRRPEQQSAELLTAGEVALDSAAHLAYRDQQPLQLTLKEYAVLEYLMRNKGRVLTREQILEHCWDGSFDSFSNIVDVYIKQLRSKLADADEDFIKTIRGVGYRIHE